MHPSKLWTILILILCFILSLVNLITYWIEDMNHYNTGQFGPVFNGLSIIEIILLLPAIYLIASHWNGPLPIRDTPAGANFSAAELTSVRPSSQPSATPTVRPSTRPSAQWSLRPSAPTLPVSDENAPPPSYDSIVKTISLEVQPTTPFNERLV